MSELRFRDRPLTRNFRFGMLDKELSKFLDNWDGDKPPTMLEYFEYMEKLFDSPVTSVFNVMP